MMKFLRQTRLLSTITFLLLLALPACAPSSATVQPQGTNEVYEIDPEFSDFYRSMGGKEFFGPPISKIITRNGIPCQYTQNALLCEDPAETGRNRFFLWPVGHDLGFGDSASGGQETGNVEIAPDFFPLYQSLGGPAVLGFPLTQPVYNQEEQRIEQIFERVGFYRLYSEPEGTAHLLPFGEMACGASCRDTPAKPPTLQPYPPPASISGASPFPAFLESYGGEGIFGRPLTAPYQTVSGDLEQVFENVVVYSSQASPDQARLRPVSRALNMQTMPPAPFDPNQGNVKFYETGGGLGYHVPVIFEDYLNAHGGYDLSGPPIANALLYQDENIIRQCFENYCLDYNPQSEAVADQIKLTRLGQLYLDLGLSQPPGDVQPAETQTLEPQPESQPLEVDLILSEAHPQISPDETQNIHILVFEKGTQTGVSGITALVTLAINGSAIQMTTPPTDENGWTSVAIPPFPNIQNSQVVPYQVCLNLPDSQPVCLQESYLIWNSK